MPKPPKDVDPVIEPIKYGDGKAELVVIYCDEPTLLEAWKQNGTPDDVARERMKKIDANEDAFIQWVDMGDGDIVLECRSHPRDMNANPHS